MAPWSILDAFRPPLGHSGRYGHARLYVTYRHTAACFPLKRAPTAATLKLTRSRCTSHSGPSKLRGELMHAPRHCALAVRAGSSSSGGQSRDLRPSTPPRGHGEPWEAGPRPIPTWLRQALSIACVWLPGWSVLVYSCIILRPGYFNTHNAPVAVPPLSQAPGAPRPPARAASGLSVLSLYNSYWHD